MNRRRFLRAGCGCSLAALAGVALAQDPWQVPPRFARPEKASDEGGLWAMMDREETKLRRSPFNLRDPQLQPYIQQIACRLGGAHCPDIRVYLVRTPYFNASMAPNGMMQVWTGLMLRVDNEAQLAAVLGHEIGHYMERHSLERLRAAKSSSAVGQFLGMFGVVGLLGSAGLVAGMYAYSRDNERDADRIGALLMHDAGYDIAEAAKVWGNLMLEAQARPDGGSRNALFASHPPSDERQATLAELAASHPGGGTNEEAWQQKTAPFLRQWLQDEVKRGQHEESIALLTRAAGRPAGKAEYLCARGEVYRLRAAEGDLDAALKDFRAAAALGNEPPETHRGLGLVYRATRHAPEARTSFERYLQLAPDAADGPMIRNYLQELSV
ncbi:MAG TPA: M48 family metalloprotease [Burkholderiales bacterium]|nr:M48 family metalloprotease [Burkholderiales bacterium]